MSLDSVDKYVYSMILEHMDRPELAALRATSTSMKQRVDDSIRERLVAAPPPPSLTALAITPFYDYREVIIERNRDTNNIGGLYKFMHDNQPRYDLLSIWTIDSVGVITHRDFEDNTICMLTRPFWIIQECQISTHWPAPSRVVCVLCGAYTSHKRYWLKHLPHSCAGFVSVCNDCFYNPICPIPGHNPAECSFQQFIRQI